MQLAIHLHGDLWPLLGDPTYLVESGSLICRIRGQEGDRGEDKGGGYYFRFWAWLEQPGMVSAPWELHTVLFHQMTHNPNPFL